ncbi:unnamed protein product [Effrenium voratum]|nr:unnamed protein product [Effrenium voratum]
MATSRDVAGEAIYSAIFEAAPTLQPLFKTPRAVMSMRFMNGLNTIIASMMDNPSALKVTTETLGFQHLDLDVTAPRVGMFRDAIVELFETELQARFSSKAKSGLMSILNYVGGAYIFIRREYASRIKIITKSWKTANKAQERRGRGERRPRSSENDSSIHKTISTKGNSSTWTKDGAKENKETREAREAKRAMETMKVPTTFNEMFIFNAAVMGFSSSNWMTLVLEQFASIVTNAANSYRLQEECDILALRLAKYRGPIQLNEFKAVMLAALRSLVPREWSSEHEVAWTWLWENVESVSCAASWASLSSRRRPWSASSKASRSRHWSTCAMKCTTDSFWLLQQDKTTLSSRPHDFTSSPTKSSR